MVQNQSASFNLNPGFNSSTEHILHNQLSTIQEVKPPEIYFGTTCLLITHK